MTQEQIIALETVLDLAEIAINDYNEHNSPTAESGKDMDAVWIVGAYLVKQRTLASLQRRINALD